MVSAADRDGLGETLRFSADRVGHWSYKVCTESAPCNSLRESALQLEKPPLLLAYTAHAGTDEHIPR